MIIVVVIVFTIINHHSHRLYYHLCHRHYNHCHICCLITTTVIKILIIVILIVITFTIVRLSSSSLSYPHAFIAIAIDIIIVIVTGITIVSIGSGCFPLFPHAQCHGRARSQRPLVARGASRQDPAVGAWMVDDDASLLSLIALGLLIMNHVQLSFSLSLFIIRSCRQQPSDLSKIQPIKPAPKTTFCSD